MRAIITVTIIITSLSGCQQTPSGLQEGATSTVLSSAAQSAIAGDMARHLAEQLGDKRNGVYYFTGEASEPIGAMETALRPWGLTFLADAGAKEERETAVPIAYDIHAFEGALLVRLKTPRVALSRTYQASSDTARPSSPLAVAHPG